MLRDERLQPSPLIKDVLRAPAAERMEDCYSSLLWIKQWIGRGGRGLENKTDPTQGINIGNADPEAAATQPLKYTWRQLVRLWFQSTTLSPYWRGGDTLANAAKKRWAPESFDIIVSSFPSIGCFRAAADLSKAWNIPWVADFRDQWGLGFAPTGAGIRFVRSRLVRREENLTKTASRILVLSEEMFPFVAGPDAKKSGLLTPRPDNMSAPLPIDHFQPRDEVCIRYFGAANPATGMSLFVKWLRRYLQEAAGPGRVRFEFAGPEYDIGWLQPYCREAGLPESAWKYLGPLPHAQALEAMRSADLLLMRGENQYAQACCISGKFYEYAVSGRPMILPDLHAVSARSRLIKQWRLGCHCQTYPEFKDYLDKMLVDRPAFEDHFAAERQADVAEELSKEQLGAKLLSLLHEVAGK